MKKLNTDPKLSPQLTDSTHSNFDSISHEPVREIEINLPEYKGFFIDEPGRFSKKRK